MFCSRCGLPIQSPGRFCPACGGALPPFPLASGSELDGARYQVVELLKAGGMGAVYRAFDRRLKKEVALKQLLGGPDAWAEERFSAEGEWLSRLRHPALPRVTDVFCHDGCRFLVMDLVPGQDLESWVEGQGPMPPERVRDIALQRR